MSISNNPQQPQNSMPYSQVSDQILDSKCRIFKINNDTVPQTEEEEQQRHISDLLNNATRQVMSELTEFLQNECRASSQKTNTQRVPFNHETPYWNSNIEKALYVSQTNPQNDLADLYDRTLNFLNTFTLRDNLETASQLVSEEVFKHILPSSYGQLINDVQQKASAILNQSPIQKVILLSAANGKTVKDQEKDKTLAAGTLMRIFAHKIIAHTAKTNYDLYRT